MNRAIILCSGGLDSVVCAHYVKKKLNYSSVTVLFFNYGQRSLKAERKAARACAVEIKARFVELQFKLNYLGAPLMQKNKRIRNQNSLHDTEREHSIWYVPGRNTLFLSHALSFAESYSPSGEKTDIFVGFKCEGREPYPDTTPAYVKSVNLLARTAFKNIAILAPFIKKDKEDIIMLGQKLCVDLSTTMSCYAPTLRHCGTCLACRLRKQGFYWANMHDPTSYSA
ncbi:MAG TPA: 7-cyano-7-deazaguanine synthase [Candidatus Nanoarchaeia archaeon]|nr:7-cyano-7-deazaguanine synthase [Candidatus Nanoarchaeia archaeon]